MKLLVDLTPLYNRKLTGVEIYGIEFYEALKKTSHEIIPVFRKENLIDTNSNAIIINCENRFLVENIYLSCVVRKIKPDVAFFPIFPPPIDLLYSNIKIVPTLHDLAFLYFRETLSFSARLYLKPKCNLALKRSYKILSVSNTVKNEISQISNIPVINCGENISRLYDIAPSYEFDKSILERLGVNENDYLVTVSTLEPRKNFGYLLDVFQGIHKVYPDLKLVLVGRKGWGNDKKFNYKIAELGDSIVCSGYISDDDLISLYHYSRAFMLFSLYEGFGRTPVEALACGANVIVSDIPVFHEVLGNNVHYVPLNNRELAVNYIVENINVKISNEINPSIFNILDVNIIRDIDNIIM